MCSCFSKYEDQCSVAMMQAGKETFANNCDQFETMKTFVKAYAHKRECSVQEAVYRNLPEFHL